MTRHARNCTAGAVYTYNEKKRDANESGYGTNAKRLGKDSIKSFDCCSLTLQPCRNPVVSKHGHLFDKEAILQYIITKKNEHSRKLKEYERQRQRELNSDEAVLNRERLACIAKFKEVKGVDSATVPDDNAPSTSKQASSTSLSNLANGNDKKLPSFWVPSECPDAGVAKLEKPDSTIYCPVSQQPLRFKDLIDVKFTPLKDGDTQRSLIAKEARYMCPVTHDILTNAVPCAVLRPTGDVVTMECVEKLIRKDMLHPLTGQKLKEKDIIALERGGTGYAITNERLESKEKRPMLMA